MAKNQNSKEMTDLELAKFADNWVLNYGAGATAEDRQRILDYTNLTEDQADTVIAMIATDH